MIQTQRYPTIYKNPTPTAVPNLSWRRCAFTLVTCTANLHSTHSSGAAPHPFSTPAPNTPDTCAQSALHLHQPRPGTRKTGNGRQAADDGRQRTAMGDYGRDRGWGLGRARLRFLFSGCLERPLLHNGHFQDGTVGCSDKARHIRHFAIINVSRIVLGKVAECIRGLR